MMRQRERYTATMDPKLLAKLDLAKGRVPRSLMIEEAVKQLLEQLENVEKMRALYGPGPVNREVPAGK